ncbi:MAG: EpsG family protein [Bacteroidaceae bacterium]|nr:EpsG family protein [Bacteroidaceae bacterium]
MYYLALVGTLFPSLLFSLKSIKADRLFAFVFLFLGALAVFRYGQGQDYFNYRDLYDSVDYYWSNQPLLLLLQNDPGYVLFNLIAIILGVPYTVFMAIFTAIILALFYFFLSRTCRCSFVSLFLFYGVIYMIYVLSVVRQGFCMAVFYAVLYPMLKKKKLKQYVIGAILLSTIHLSSLLFLLFPFVKFQMSNRKILFLFLVSIVALFIGPAFLSKIPIGVIQERLGHYLSESSDNLILAKVVRCLIIIPLFFLPSKLLNDKELYYCRTMMFCGFFIYSFTSFSELTCSRLWGFFLGFECIILSRLSHLKSLKSYRRGLLLYYMVITLVLWFKDINAAIVQGEYRYCSMFSYPYISVLDSEDVLNHYRTNLGFSDKF